MPAPPESRRQETEHDDRPASTSGPSAGNCPAPDRTGKPAPDRGKDEPLSPAVPAPAAAASPAPPARSPRKQPLPEITSDIIAESQYELIRAPGHHETRAWHVLAGGTRAGLVRPTWRGERSRPGWETVDNTGLPLPATGIGRVTPAGNARTRDAAAVSLLRALQHQQENEHKGQTLTMRTSTNRGHPCICQATIQLAEAELFREFQYLTVPLHLTAADARAALEKAGWLTGQEVSW